MAQIVQNKDAIFSPCRKYRYTLWRGWANDWDTNYAMFIALNPSTADEIQDDNTVRRCIRFAQDWGYSGLLMTNVFGYRATLPKDMMAITDPVGIDNDRYLAEYAKKAGVIIAAWGNHATHQNRHHQVVSLIPNLHCLKITKAGMPGHPLYLSKNLRPIPYNLSVILALPKNNLMDQA